jgi:hypothetical protein
VVKGAFLLAVSNRFLANGGLSSDCPVNNRLLLTDELSSFGWADLSGGKRKWEKSSDNCAVTIRPSSSETLTPYRNA